MDCNNSKDSMALILSISERLSRATADFRAGIPVIITGDQGYFLVLPLETLDDVRLADLRRLGSPYVAVTDKRAVTLKARTYDGDMARITVPGGHGLSWLRAMADPARDLDFPMKGPFQELRDTRSAAARAAIALAKRAHLLPAVIVVETSQDQAQDLGAHLTTLAAADVTTDDLAGYHAVSAARVPLAVSKAGHVHVFRPQDGGDEHYAIEIGKPDRSKPVLVRLHSACFTGDLLGSLKCDCGAQLQAALRAMGEEGEGVLLYLNQEGRGIGLANKMRAYALQDQGFDTVEANHRLGFEDDERDFRIGAEILKELGFSSVRLMTNNPGKIEKMKARGIDVTERVPLKVGRNKVNDAYLRTKAKKSGHML